jgi:hypothetical protein
MEREGKGVVETIRSFRVAAVNAVLTLEDRVRKSDGQ